MKGADIMTTITLSNEHMLVLFDMISRLNSDESVLFADAAEQRVLWDLEAELERTLPVVLSPDYRAQVDAARSRLRDAAE